MALLSRISFNLKTLSVLFLRLLLINILALIRSLIGAITASGQRILTTDQFLAYIEDKNPATCCTKSLIRLESTECMVCLSIFEEGESVRNLKCNHLFHKDCLDKWFQQCRSSCPICRSKVLPDKVVARYRRPKDDDTECVYDTSTEEDIVFLLSPLNDDGFW